MDIIAAIATAPVPSAIGVVRVSGEGCHALCDRVFRAADGRAFSSRPPRTLIYGDILDETGAVLDRGLAVRFSAPHSYTGEDSAEFDCHGSPVVLQEVLRALCAFGARQAQAGEFTRRAFLNGRMDLTQAEAVIDLIDAETAAAAKNAAAQMGGALRRKLEAVQDILLDVTSRFYAVVDYPDEDVADVRPQDLSAALDSACAVLDGLLDTCARGRVLKLGVRTAIVGRPNVGKSSLLNALAGYDRAIVTPVPGTTRDTVEESCLCGGVRLRLVDTAGLRDTADPVERLGVARARAALESAELVLAVADGSAPFTPEDAAALRLAADAPHWILIWSKADLRAGPQRTAPPAAPARAPDAVVSVSCVTGEGLDALAHAIAVLYPSASPAEAGSLLTDQRQEDAARRAREALCRAREALRAGLTPDAVLTDAEEALSAVGELTGRTAREDIVERIFSRFCVGK